MKCHLTSQLEIWLCLIGCMSFRIIDFEFQKNILPVSLSLITYVFHRVVTTFQFFRTLGTHGLVSISGYSRFCLKGCVAFFQLKKFSFYDARPLSTCDWKPATWSTRKDPDISIVDDDFADRTSFKLFAFSFSRRIFPEFKRLTCELNTLDGIVNLKTLGRTELSWSWVGGKLSSSYPGIDLHFVA